MALEKRKNTCSSCETKYTISWDIEEQDLEPITCPFCGHEVEHEEYEEERHEDEEGRGLDEDESWN